MDRLIRWILVFCLLLIGGGHGIAKEQLAPAMTFKLIRSSETNCYAYCPAWIAAEGRIASNTAAKFAKLLKDPSLRHLPIILTSSGGDLDAALTMGRLISKYKMVVGIGRSVTEKCEGACKKQKWHSGYIRENGSYCFSACPLVLLGGNLRLVSTTSQIGLHQPTQTMQPYVDRYLESYRIVKGKKKVISRKFIKRTYLKVKTTIGLNKRLAKQLGSYLAEMKASPQILIEMEKAKPKDINIIRNGATLENLGFDNSGGLTLDRLFAASHCNAVNMPKNCVLKQ